jgi:hypothetical protein
MIAPLLDAVFVSTVMCRWIGFGFGYPIDAVVVIGGISTKDLGSNPFVVFVGRLL